MALLERSMEQTNVTRSVAKITGWVSKAGTGVGRSNNDRQFVFINQRPVDIPKITRTMNNVWRLYEMKHKPAYILNLTLPPGSFDVNVTPDKRQVLLTNEAHILEPLEEAIKKFWETSQYTYKVRDIGSHFQARLAKAANAQPTPKAQNLDKKDEDATPTSVNDANASVKSLQENERIPEELTKKKSIKGNMPTVVAKDVILDEQRVQQLTVSNPGAMLVQNGDTGQMRKWVYQHATCAARESIAGKGHRNSTS